MLDAHSDQTTLQTAMLRERAFSEQRWAPGANHNSGTALKPAAGGSIRVQSKGYESKWGSIRSPDGSLPNGYVPRSLNKEVVPLFAAASTAPLGLTPSEVDPSYALKNASSVVFESAPAATQQAYSKVKRK